MTEPKKYRTDWTIEPDNGPSPMGVKWYKHQIDMDNVHYCTTFEEAESEIDDAIILEQEQVIEKFRMTLLDCVQRMQKCRGILQDGTSPGNWGILDTYEAQQLINAFKS